MEINIEEILINQENKLASSTELVPRPRPGPGRPLVWYSCVYRDR